MRPPKFPNILLHNLSALNTLHAEIERLDRAYWEAAICYLAKTDPLAFVHIDIDPRRLRPSPARAEGL